MTKMNGEPSRSVPAEVKQGTLIEGRARRRTPPPLVRKSGPRVTPELLLYALARWWMFALPLGAALAVVGWFATYKFMPRTYRASVWIQIEAERPMLAYELPDSRKFVRNQFALMKSPVVLNEVLRQPEVANLPEIRESENRLAALEEGLSIQAVDNSDIYQVNFDMVHREHAELIVEAIVEQYLVHRNKLATDDSDKTIATLQGHMVDQEKQMARLRSEVQDKASEIASLGSGSSLIDLTDRNFIDKSQASLGPLQSRLSEAEVERKLLEARLETVRSTLGSAANPTAAPQLGQAVETDPLLQRLRMNEMDLSNRITRSRELSGWGKDHPRRKVMETELEEIRESITSREEELQQRVSVQQERQETLAVRELEQKIELQKQLEGLIKDQLENERQRLRLELAPAGDIAGEKPNQRMELAFLQMQLQQTEEVYNILFNRVAAMKTERLADDGRVRLLDKDVALQGGSAQGVNQDGLGSAEAQVVVYSEPGPKALAAVFLGLLAPFGLATLHEIRLQRITHGDQLAEESQLPVIAEISRLPLTSIRKNRVQRIGLSQALFEESIDQLRTSLMVPDELQDVQVLATVSAVSGEGKSSIASQLAVSLARATQEPVLIIDGDTRSPSLHEMFDVSLEPGVVDLLKGSCRLSDVVQRHGELVHVVAAGVLDTNPHALVTAASLRRLIDEARPHYRYIIIDCPPILAASEAFVLAKSADAAVVCAMRDVSRGYQVKKACSRLQSVGVRTLGMILSGVPTLHYRYRYGSYHYEHANRSNGRTQQAARRPQLPLGSRSPK